MAVISNCKTQRFEDVTYSSTFGALTLHIGLLSASPIKPQGHR